MGGPLWGLVLVKQSKAELCHGLGSAPWTSPATVQACAVFPTEAPWSLA